MKGKLRFLIPVLAMALIAIVLMGVSNPDSKYSSEKYWKTATPADAEAVPKALLTPGNSDGAILMWAASSTPNPDVIKTLISRGARVNEKDYKYGGTALMSAAADNPNPVIIRTLVEEGAKVDVHTSEGVGPLYVAASFNENPAVLEELISLGGDPYKLTNNGNSVVVAAEEENNQKVVSFLATRYPAFYQKEKKMLIKQGVAKANRRTKWGYRQRF